MVLDILLAIILIAGLVLGYRSGFIWAFFHTLGWIIALLLAFFLTPRMREFLYSNTDLYQSIHEGFGERIAETANVHNITTNLPRLFRESADRLAHQTTDAASEFLGNIVFSIVSFLAVLFIVKLLFFIIILLLSKKYATGVAGVLDGISGMIFGLIKSVFLIFALLTIMIPVLSMFDTGLVDTVSGWLDSSYFAGTLYDNNFLTVLLRDFVI